MQIDENHVWATKSTSFQVNGSYSERKCFFAVFLAVLRYAGDYFFEVSTKAFGVLGW